MGYKILWAFTKLARLYFVNLWMLFVNWVFQGAPHRVPRFVGSDGGRNWVHVGRTRPMNPKWLYLVLLCTYHLRGLTEVYDCDHFSDECDHFLHGVFPYIRNPSESLIHYPRISSGVLAVSCFWPLSIGQYTHIWVKTVYNCIFSHFLAFYSIYLLFTPFLLSPMASCSGEFDNSSL